ncbi:hypothetical protein HMSSN139_30380 [Paenibacillus sp. HMSSN-139]|nr:hypothetical protein HMSSN139_30380 [Paenibacillus sp. HMSSN-139]
MARKCDDRYEIGQNEHLIFVKIDTNEPVAEIRFFTLSEWERNKSDWELLARDADKSDRVPQPYGFESQQRRDGNQALSRFLKRGQLN